MDKRGAKQMSDTLDEAAVDAVRTKLYAGIVPVSVFAKARGVTNQTIRFYIALGMPAVWIGPAPYPVVDAAVEWIRTRKQREMAFRRPT
jgi:hypothetical protein